MLSESYLNVSLMSTDHLKREKTLTKSAIWTIKHMKDKNSISTSCGGEIQFQEQYKS